MSEQALKLTQSIAHDIWDTYGYRTEKQTINASQDLSDWDGSMLYFYNQFDRVNQGKFMARLIERMSEAGAMEVLGWVVGEEVERHNLEREL